MPEIVFEQSIWFVPLCVLLAAALAYLVYSKKAPWSTLTNRLLTVMRFLLFFVLMILLLNPLLNQLVSEVEPPTFIIALDNSTSMASGRDSLSVRSLLTTTEAIRQKLESKNYKVQVQTLDQKRIEPVDVRFDQKTTNLDQWLHEIESGKEDIHLGGVYLISDGKYNQGTSPAFFPYSYPVFALGVGDTLQKEDLVLQNVFYNKIAYQGNKFPVVLEVVNHGFANQSTVVEIRGQGKKLATERITFNSAEGLQRVALEVEAEKKGMQQLDIRLHTLTNESVTGNNFRRIYVDVVDGKQKILLVGPSPHPDMKALAAVIDKNQNYELTTYIPGLTELKSDKYDLIISHQAYSRYKKANDVVDDHRASGVPVLLIFGEESNILMASRTEELFTFRQKGAKRDNVFGVVNEDFNLFTLSEEVRSDFAHYPPVSVPYGDASLMSDDHVLLYQRVGSIQTNKPLLYLSERNGIKSGYMLAEGLWKWRMQEYALNESSDSFDELFLKTIQYLCTKVDKRKFKFYPSTNTYFENESVRFHAEIYNQIYERIYGVQVQVKVSNQDGFSQEYNFTPTSSYSRLEASNFAPGLYQYEAAVSLNGKREVIQGRFSVKELQLEELDQVADFGLLRHVAHNTEGKFYTQAEKLLADIDRMQLPGIIHSHEDILPVIHLRWILFVLLFFITLEWFSRKYNGGY